ncbi:FliI/YscN family ATPase [Microbulbifer sp. GL-2]|uniref:FliI/YscN family ATPase n=1 Tax=Microbulbifer sp. GL-2 TaxID=2591606 RepID=UPI0011643A90|nr:FliI/YscN family ATPase [Microbulbifer sp. GL-2]BBM00346.1 flagellum-specific ATP synthase [Microbulbifer sp. GL-2]
MNTTASLVESIKTTNTIGKFGKLVSFHGTYVSATGVAARIGDLCYIYKKNKAEKIRSEVVGFDKDNIILMPFDTMTGLMPGDRVERINNNTKNIFSDRLIGRVIDALGEPLDSLGDISSIGNGAWKTPGPINPFERKRIDTIANTGIPIIDGLLTLGEGQRVGIFSGSGVGKTTLINQLLSASDTEVNVIALIGERGREVTEFIECILGKEGLSKSVVIVASAEQPPLCRVYAAHTAAKIAEYFSYQGKDVLLTIDSITRLAMAQREIGLARGEPPSVKGYTPSCYSILPNLIEKSGAFKTRGTITAYYTVLVEGDDMSDPVADYMRGILDGHIVLDRDIAAQGKYPAVNIQESVSRAKGALINDAEKSILMLIYKYHSLFHESKSMIDIGAYKEGENVELDKAIYIEGRINDLFYTGKSLDRNTVMDELSDIISSASQRVSS